MDELYRVAVVQATDVVWVMQHSVVIGELSAPRTSVPVVEITLGVRVHGKRVWLDSTYRSMN